MCRRYPCNRNWKCIQVSYVHSWRKLSNVEYRNSKWKWAVARDLQWVAAIWSTLEDYLLLHSCNCHCTRSWAVSSLGDSVIFILILILGMPWFTWTEEINCRGHWRSGGNAKILELFRWACRLTALSPWISSHKVSSTHRNTFQPHISSPSAFSIAVL